MKTIFRLLCGLMAIAITTACSHEELLQTEPVQKPAEGKMVSVKAYTPSEQPASRLAFDDQGTEGLKLSWSEGDAFTAVVGNDKVTFTYDANTKEFSGTLPDGATLTDEVSAYYPAYDGESFEMDLSQQTGALNSATTYMEGAYDATAQAFRFTHSTAILKVAFSGLPDGATISSVSIVGAGDDVTISNPNATEAVYVNLLAIAKDTELKFDVRTSDGTLYTATKTVTAEEGIKVGVYYNTTVALQEACLLPTGSAFNAAIKAVNGYSDVTSIVFEANSTESGGTQIGTSTAYAKVDGTTLKIYTAANEFVFNASCYNMFDGLSTITAIDFNDCVNTLNVTSMGSIFYGCSALTSLNLSGFNTSNVTNMGSMFSGCSALTSLDLSMFNTSNVTNMGAMFYKCSSLESLDLSGFNTEKVEYMNSMFYDCKKLSSLNVSSFNTANVTAMVSMFDSCSALESLNLSSFNTANVTNMYKMFSDCYSLTSLDLRSFDFSQVTDFDYMFDYLGSSATNKPIPVYVTAAGYNILKDKDTNIPNSATYVYPCELPTGSTFNASVNSFLESNTSLTKIKFIANSDNTNMYNPIETSGAYMVAGSDNTLEIHTAAAEFVFNADCSGMFYNLTKIQSIDFGNCVKTGGVTDMYYMFATCKALTSLDLRCFDTAAVNDMSQMFLDCSSLTSLYVSSFNTSSVTDMSSMFYSCSKLTTLDLLNFDTSKVTSMYCMFYECLALTGLNLRSFNFKNVTDFEDMFYALGRDVAVKPVYIYVKDENDKAKLEAALIDYFANYDYAEIHIK